MNTIQLPQRQTIEINGKTYAFLSPIHKLNKKVIELGTLGKKILDNPNNTNLINSSIDQTEAFIVAAIGEKAIEDITEGIPVDMPFIQALYELLAKRVIELMNQPPVVD